jgi:serine/threonine protein kinase
MKYLPGICDEAHEVLKLMLKISSQKRANAIEALAQPWLSSYDDNTPSTQDSINKQTLNSPI